MISQADIAELFGNLYKPRIFPDNNHFSINFKDLSPNLLLLRFDIYHLSSGFLCSSFENHFPLSPFPFLLTRDRDVMLPRTVRTLRLHEGHLGRDLLRLARDQFTAICDLDGNRGATVRIRVVVQRHHVYHGHSVGRCLQKEFLLNGD